MFQKRLKQFPTLSPRLRVYMIRLQTLANLAFPCALLIQNFILIIFLYQFFSTVVQPFGLGYYHLAILDMSLVLGIAWLLFRNSFIVGFGMGIVSFVHRLHMNDCNAMMENIIKRYRCDKCPKFRIHQWDLIRLKYFLGEHHKFSQQIDCANRKLISSSLFWIIITEIPVNIYFIYRVIYYELVELEMLVTVLVLLAHSLLLSLILIPMAYCNEGFYKVAQHFPNVQFVILNSSENVTLKLKYEGLYDRLVEARIRIGFSMGPVRTIRFYTLVEFVLAYVLYLLCIFGLLRHIKSL